MNRWLYWAPVWLLTLGVGLYGLRLGWLAASITETDVINTYAARYVAAQKLADPESAASVLDCIAVPGDARGVWLIVICGSGGCGPAYSEFHVNRFGGFVHGGDTACPDAALQRRTT